MVRRWSLAAARFCSAAWFGAAALFVIAGIREVRSPELDSAARDAVVLLRFPCYYVVGFGLVIFSILGLLVSQMSGFRSRVGKVALILLVLSLLGMIADFNWVYTPLEEHIRAQGPRDARFTALHEASKWMNLANVSLCALASWLLCLAPTAISSHEVSGTDGGPSIQKA